MFSLDYRERGKRRNEGREGKGREGRMRQGNLRTENSPEVSYVDGLATAHLTDRRVTECCCICNRTGRVIGQDFTLTQGRPTRLGRRRSLPIKIVN